MKFANVKNEFEMTGIMQKKYLHCWSAGGGERSIGRSSFAYGFTEDIK